MDRHRRYCRRLLRASAFVALLVLWGNAKSALLESTATLPGGSDALAVAGVGLVGFSLAAARVLGLDAGALGLRGPWLRGAALGLAIGAGVAAVAIATLDVLGPIVTGSPVAYTPIASVSPRYLAWHITVLLPLSVVLPEEIAFRGVALALLVQRTTVMKAVLGSAAAFASWHVAIAFDTIGRTTLAPGSLLAGIGIVGALLLVGAGGAIFAWLRLRTGTLATSMAAHWSFNAAVLIGLWATR